MGKTTCYIGYLFTNSGQYAKVYLKTGKTIVGKLTSIDTGKGDVHLEEMLSKEQGKKTVETTTPKSDFALNVISGMSELEPRYYEQLKHIRYTEYLDKYVCVRFNGLVERGKLDRITHETIELRPFLNKRLKRNKIEFYREEGRSLIITLPIKTMGPEFEENLKRIIKQKG